MADRTETELDFYQGEDGWYVFDYSRDLEVVNGETLSAPAVAMAETTSPALTATSAAVLAQDFKLGTKVLVPAGKGVKVRLAGGLAGTTYTLTCSATLSGGGTGKVRGRLKVS